ncbi:MAG: M48 family metallopeptidase [Clostridia bacterium]|nr:M48 family metallopeptidase [Clostridia bacterium]
MEGRGILKYNGEIIEYTINTGKRKRVYLNISNGELQVRVPNRISRNEIERIVNEKAKWIYDTIKKYPKIEPVELKFDTGDIFYILGNKYVLEVCSDLKIKKDKIEIINGEEENKLVVYLKGEKSALKVKRILKKYYNTLAEEEISFAMEKLIRKTNLIPEAFKIRNFKRAWGNCSSKKLISINAEIIKYSRNAIEYVCLHELCHLKYMNHSKDFWNLVSFYMPNYKIAENELKEVKIKYK